MELSKEVCVACRRDAPLATDAEIALLYPEVSNWQLEEVDGIKQLKRKFRFANFSDALDFVIHVGQSAEEVGHHPLLILEWGQVEVNWWTHKIRGLHRNDFIMAAKTDLLFQGIN